MLEWVSVAKFLRPFLPLYSQRLLHWVTASCCLQSAFTPLWTPCFPRSLSEISHIIREERCIGSNMQQQMLTLAAFHTLDKQPRHTTFFVIVGLCLVQVCCYLEKKKRNRHYFCLAETPDRPRLQCFFLLPNNNSFSPITHTCHCCSIVTANSAALAKFLLSRPV